MSAIADARKRAVSGLRITGQGGNASEGRFDLLVLCFELGASQVEKTSRQIALLLFAFGPGW